MKVIIARIIATLIALLTISASLINIFAPESQIESSKLVPEGIAGLSNFRVNASGFLAAGVFAALAAVKKRRDYLIPIAVFFGCVLFARLVGIVSDGLHPIPIRFTILATGVLLATLTSHYLMRSDSDSHNG